jgi:drug/metabolite transporter (DMT)-like permease
MNPWTPLVGATLGWGASAVLNRAALLRGVDTMTLVLLRMAFALVTLAIYIVVSGKLKPTSRQAWKYGLVLGTLGMAVPMTLMTASLRDLPVSLGGLLVALVPLSTIGAAHFVVPGERFQARSLPGLLVALAGSAVLVGIGGGSAEGVGNLWRGVVLMVCGITVAGVGGALSRRLALRVQGSQLVLPQFTVNTVTLAVVVPLVFGLHVDSVHGVSWLLIAGVGMVGTTLAFASFLIGAGMNPASRLALTGYAVPVVAVALAVMFLGEHLTVSIVIGAVLIVIGVVLAERATSHVPEPGVATAR